MTAGNGPMAPDPYLVGDVLREVNRLERSQRLLDDDTALRVAALLDAASAALRRERGGSDGRIAELEAQRQAVIELHPRVDPHHPRCGTCVHGGDWDNYGLIAGLPTSWPCPTLRALGVEE